VALAGEICRVFTSPTAPTWPLQQQQRRLSSRSPAAASMTTVRAQAQAAQRQQHLSHRDAHAHCAIEVGGDARRLAANLSGGGGSTGMPHT
jgi:hypothetical protein